MSEYPEPHKPKMKTGKKIGIGCGGFLGLIIILGACLPDAPKDEKAEADAPKAATTAPAVAKTTEAPKSEAEGPSKLPRLVVPLPGGDVPAWETAMLAQGIKFEDKGSVFTPPGGQTEDMKDWKGENRRPSQGDGIFLKAQVGTYASDGAIRSVRCKVQKSAAEESKAIAFFKACTTAINVSGLDAAKLNAFIDQNARTLLESTAGNKPAVLDAGPIRVRISDLSEANAAEITIEAQK
ncbi:hypothetical protein ACE1OC_28455 [Streptomyces sp. DSM 116496]|uniref:hypothetical protein n=1 Tax=Streptomyces stoeckheimensis TaxID=3344656 RepID=UPI0038B3106B